MRGVRRLASALLMAACAALRPTPETALRDYRTVGQALSDSYTAWFHARAQAARTPEDFQALKAVEARWNGLMGAYRAAATAAWFAAHQPGAPPPDWRDAEKALADVVTFLRSLGATVPEVFP